MKAVLDFSLLGGDFGKVIYLYYAAQNGLCDVEEVHPLLDKVLSNTFINTNRMTYCHGIAGLCAGLIQLEKDGIIEGAIESVSIYRKYIIECARAYIKKSDLDFLHGGIGITLPLLHLAKSDDEVNNFIKETVSTLFVKSIKGKENDVFWLYKNRKGEFCENMSLSHGIASTSQYLARCISVLDDCSEREKALDLLEGIGTDSEYVVNYIKCSPFSEIRYMFDSIG